MLLRPQVCLPCIGPRQNGYPGRSDTRSALRNCGGKVKVATRSDGIRWKRGAMQPLNKIGVLAWCAGIAACIGLAAWSGIHDVANSVASVGWGMPCVVLARVAAVFVAGTGWWLVFPADGRLPFRAAILLRFVREGVNTLLPLTQVGGDVIGARLLTFWAVRGPLAAASIIIDVFMQAATQFVFGVLGLATLIVLDADTVVAKTAATGLSVVPFMLGGFFLAQREGGQRILLFVLGLLKIDSYWRVLGTVDAIYRSLAGIYAGRARLAASGAVHMTGWLVGVSEVWIVLHCMGQPVTVAEALVIESLVQAVRGAAFVIPGALGAQETSLILLCGILQVPPDQALALSIIKRTADLLVGGPGLFALQILEGKRLAARSRQGQ
jgi:putative membrane protein